MARNKNPRTGNGNSSVIGTSESESSLSVSSTRHDGEEGDEVPSSRNLGITKPQAFVMPRRHDDPERKWLLNLERLQHQGLMRNPFAQSLLEEPAGHGANDQPSSGGQTTMQLLEKLFRPPYTLMSHLSWDEARIEGREEKKWILANLHDSFIFQCQMLNRDVWKVDVVSRLVEECFIFLQFARGDMRAEAYVSRYYADRKDESVDRYPHVSIIDPRTGEQVEEWLESSVPLQSADMYKQLVKFLDTHSLATK